MRTYALREIPVKIPVIASDGTKQEVKILPERIVYLRNKVLSGELGMDKQNEWAEHRNKDSRFNHLQIALLECRETTKLLENKIGALKEEINEAVREKGKAERMVSENASQISSLLKTMQDSRKILDNNMVAAKKLEESHGELSAELAYLKDLAAQLFVDENDPGHFTIIGEVPIIVMSDSKNSGDRENKNLIETSIKCFNAADILLRSITTLASSLDGAMCHQGICEADLENPGTLQLIRGMAATKEETHQKFLQAIEKVQKDECDAGIFAASLNSRSVALSKKMEAYQQIFKSSFSFAIDMKKGLSIEDQIDTPGIIKKPVEAFKRSISAAEKTGSFINDATRANKNILGVFKKYSLACTSLIAALDSKQGLLAAASKAQGSTDEQKNELEQLRKDLLRIESIEPMIEKEKKGHKAEIAKKHELGEDHRLMKKTLEEWGPEKAKKWTYLSSSMQAQPDFEEQLTHNSLHVPNEKKMAKIMKLKDRKGSVLKLGRHICLVERNGNELNIYERNDGQIKQRNNNETTVHLQNEKAEARLASFLKNAKALKDLEYVKLPAQIKNDFENAMMLLGKIYQDEDSKLTSNAIYQKFDAKKVNHMTLSGKNKNEFHIFKIGFYGGNKYSFLIDIKDNGKPLIYFAGQNNAIEQFISHNKYVGCRRTSDINGKFALFEVLKESQTGGDSKPNGNGR